MDDLMQTFSQLGQAQQKQLLAFADSLLLQQKTQIGKGNLAKWKQKIQTVSIWTADEISRF